MQVASEIYGTLLPEALMSKSRACWTMANITVIVKVVLFRFGSLFVTNPVDYP
jgi:hypothetical protein